MKPQTILLLVALLALGLALTGTAQAAPTDLGITVSFQRSGPADAISSAPFTSRTTAGPQSGATATPHPILSDVRVRQAIAYCTDKAGLLASVYPSFDRRTAAGADRGYLHSPHQLGLHSAGHDVSLRARDRPGVARPGRLDP